MKINIMDYLDDEEIKEICIEEVKRYIKIMDHLDNKEIKEICIEEIKRYIRINDVENLNRIIANAAYHKVFNVVDELLPQGYAEQITENVERIIANQTSFSPFRWRYPTGKPERRKKNEGLRTL
jgi:hypothetical protein